MQPLQREARVSKSPGNRSAALGRLQDHAPSALHHSSGYRAPSHSSLAFTGQLVIQWCEPLYKCTLGERKEMTPLVRLWSGTTGRKKFKRNDVGYRCRGMSTIDRLCREACCLASLVAGVVHGPPRGGAYRTCSVTHVCPKCLSPSNTLRV